MSDLVLNGFFFFRKERERGEREGERREREEREEREEKREKEKRKKKGTGRKGGKTCFEFIGFLSSFSLSLLQIGNTELMDLSPFSLSRYL